MPLRSFLFSTADPLPGTQVRLFGAGHFRNGSGRPVRHARWAKCTTPHLVVSGEGWVKTPRGEALLQVGDLFCPFQGEFIEYADAPDAPWEYYWVSLAGEGATALVGTCGFSLSCQCFRVADWKPLRRAWEGILGSIAKAGNAGSLLPYARLFALLDLIRSSHPHLPEKEEAPPELLQRAEAILDDAADQLNVEELSEALRVHRTTLYHTLRNGLSTTPVQWLADRRHAHAKRLLAETGLKVEAVARAAGFADVKYFFRAFRHLEGMTPSAYRRQWIAGRPPAR